MFGNRTKKIERQFKELYQLVIRMDSQQSRVEHELIGYPSGVVYQLSGLSSEHKVIREDLQILKKKLDLLMEGQTKILAAIQDLVSGKKPVAALKFTLGVAVEK